MCSVVTLVCALCLCLPCIGTSRIAYIGKILQFVAFGAWFFSVGPAGLPSVLAAVGGLVCIGVGQWLNIAAINAIGKVGIYYGYKLGHVVPWYTGFPFSLVPHPQYVGSSLTVWGVCLLLGTPLHWNAGMLTIAVVWTACYVVSGAVEQYLGQKTSSKSS